MVEKLRLRTRLQAAEERLNDQGSRIVKLEDANELRQRSDRGYHDEIAELLRRLDAFENPVDDRKEVRELQLGLRRLETMVRGIVEREQDRTLRKPVNPGSVSIHAESLAQRFADVADEERDKAAAYVRRKAEGADKDETIESFMRRVTLGLQQGLHR